MIAWPLPSPEDQIVFLQQLQRLFDEGEFTATYKYALLLSLAEIAVEHGDDTGAPLELPMTTIGEKFAELYWRQAAPYQSGYSGTQSGILSQNLGTQAAVVRLLTPVFENCGGRFALARSYPLWKERHGFRDFKCCPPNARPVPSDAGRPPCAFSV